MPLAFQVANLAVKPPKVGENGYQGFNPRKEILKKGYQSRDGARALSEDMIVEHDVAVKVRDGCTLYCDIYRPVGSDSGVKVPAIVAWSPFGKKHAGIDMMKKVKWGCGVPAGCLSGLERFEGPDPAEYCPRGYAVVNVDARGAGDSDGDIVIMGKQEGEDGHDVIESISILDWCNGNIGLAGNSHLGIVQWFIAATQPPSLKAIAPWEACGDLYREQFVRGGAWDNGLFDFITEHVIRGKNGLEDFKEMYKRSSTMNPYWEDKRAEIEKINIPTYIVASYSSFVHTMGSIRGWMQIKTKDKWLRWDPYQEWYDLWAVKESIDELASFFDCYLKGEKNDWEQTPRVRMASLNYGDKEAIYPIIEEDFPIPRTDYRSLYFSSANTLQTSAPSNTSIVSYNSESNSSPVAHAAFELKFDKPTRLMGLPKAVLYMSCPDFNDMIVYVLIRKLDAQKKPMIAVNIPLEVMPYKKTADIPETDYSNLMIYYGPTGVLRASHRKIDESKSIHPQYPFHTHDEVKKITPGEIVKLEIGLWAMGVDFEAGEGISVQVSGEYPLVQEFGPRKKVELEERNKGTHQVHIGGDYPSHIVLPFV
ncbi:X-Pro dipeptidyl-peptidase C-terminal non-catalytic domain containing protein [Pyrenophora tritici-repentis]|uniref:X-Pro dipeptidyl-peptidase C-terminal non-catalytic domain containing protein n=1 Tax=Pyrenophora tritici-repentis TaxID=45151 RepID=A0A922NM11_9PLEO|nr:X-Pro dipeptidyl-peptidase C-terminal non-catalytic domain containing protein [Pyrenophora tritici-repentis]KAI1673305.1 X-Pro dipeptidyl-peptidase C-terminal non-catalytic domain containing protein [Pyrenophora tritici-repentis]KAI1689668.1 X-Pro dipeptidyl-peptidase C-terminal non-catalytic domain containing protein [Pyrenophora tritici-repentis]PZC99954.1 Peptidase-S15 multi-domain protein [Pyrenophora tritici-repentis]